jgi:xylulokinase
MEKLLLGIDIGTSACKAALFGLDGQALAQSTQPYITYYPEPGFVEQNPNDWWNAVAIAVHELLQSEKFSKEQIAGIGIDGQSWSAIPVDRQGQVLYNTPIWLDTRSADIARDVMQRLGFERIFSVSGNAFEPTYSMPKMLWFKQHKPDVYQRTYQFLQSNSFIAMKLTGVFTQDLSQGYGVQAFDIKTGSWDDQLCAEIGVDRTKLPQIYPCHSVIGELTSAAAEATGLAVGTPVVAGGLDACCGTLGAGVYEAGQTQEQGGMAGGMSICVNRPLSHPKLILGFHVVPGVWLLQGGTTGGSGTLKWFRQQLGAAEEARESSSGLNAFEIMSREASTINVGSDGLIFLPYMSGERSPLWDRHAKGVFFGLGYDKTRAHLIRAIMEGCAYSLEHNLQTAYEAGVTVKELNSMGGAANSLVWTQIKSDVTGKPINVPRSDTATTLGAAILAGVGTGQYKDFQEAVSATLQIVRKHEPDMAGYLKYQQYYGVYLELYDRLKETMSKIDSIR